MPHYETGLYMGRVVDGRVVEAKSGNDQLSIKCELMNDGAGTGTFVYVWLALTDKAWDSFVEDVLKQIGFGGDFSNITFSQAATTSVELWCKEERDEDGNDRNKWSISSGPKGKPTPNDRLSKYTTKFKARNGAQAPQPAAAPAPATAPAPAATATLPAPQMKATTKDEAWTVYVEANPKVAHEKLADQFYAGIKAHADSTGLQEEGFGPNEWNKVAEGADIPF